MPTIDDVYNLLQNAVVQTGWAMSHPTVGDQAARAGDPSLIGDTAWKVDAIYNALQSGGSIDEIHHAVTSTVADGSLNANVFDLHNLYNILTSGFPASVDAGLLPDDSFYVLIYKAVRKTWTPS